jgi:hypothetical protein
MAKANRLVELRGQLPVESSDHRRRGVLRAAALRPGLEVDEVEAVVGRRAVAEDGEAGDGVEAFTSGLLERMASIFRVTASVRSRDAASGSWTFMKK